jgi:hypothetical protein
MLQLRTQSLCIVALSIIIIATSIVFVFKSPVTTSSTFDSTHATTSSSMGVPVFFALRFVPIAAAFTRDYVSSNSTRRIFSPGRLILHPTSKILDRIPLDSFHHDACLLSQAGREAVQHSIQSVIIAQDSPQCLQTCRVSLPSPQLQCPGALLEFQLPNSMLLPAGASIFAFDGVDSINRSGLEFNWEAGTGSVVSLDAASSSVTVMQVALYIR